MAHEFIEIKYDESNIKRLSRLFAHTAAQVPTILMRGINRTINPAKTQISRELRNELNATAKRVNERIIVTPAKINRLVGTVHLSSRRLPIMTFDAKQGPTGVSYKILKTGARQIIPHTFITNVKAIKKTGEVSLHEGVFKRKANSRKVLKANKATGEKMWTELPIMELFGPSISMAYQRSGWLVQKVTNQAMTNLNKNIDAQVKFLLSKKAVA